MDKYFSKMEIIIHKILNRNEIFTFNFDILNTKKNDEIKLIVLKEKHKQMKIGEIWEEAIGNYDGFIKLKIGNDTGLDIISKSRKIIIDDVEIEIQIGYLFLKNIFGDNLEIILDFLKKTIDKY